MMKAPETFTEDELIALVLAFRNAFMLLFHISDGGDYTAEDCIDSLSEYPIRKPDHEKAARIALNAIIRTRQLARTKRGLPSPPDTRASEDV